jgi:hypothetical protein
MERGKKFSAGGLQTTSLQCCPRLKTGMRLNRISKHVPSEERETHAPRGDESWQARSEEAG